MKCYALIAIQPSKKALTSFDLFLKFVKHTVTSINAMRTKTLLIAAVLGAAGFSFRIRAGVLSECCGIR